MRMEKPMCNFINCKYHQDGNCFNASRYENCTLTDLHSEIARLRVDLDNAKSDTVRKMQERLKAEKFTHKNFGELVYVEDIDQIAKEMLEGAEEAAEKMRRGALRTERNALWKKIKKLFKKSEEQ